MKKITKHLCLLIGGSLLSLNLFGQDRSNDFLFPGKNKFQATISTGIPYVALIEGTYGITRRFAAGIIVGTTPNVIGYGIRLRAQLYQPNENFRVYFRMPVFYYASTKNFGNEPWMLSWPVITTEWKIKDLVMLSFGAGVVEAHCIDALLAGMNHHDEPMDMGFEGGFWNTFNAGIAWPISKGLTIQTETSIVLEGWEIAGSNYVGGPPVIVVLALTKNFGKSSK